MARTTKIEWCDHTFNPWIGCAKVSEGCRFCYAETLMDTRYGRVKWGKGQQRSITGAANWRQPWRWDAAAGRHQDFMEGSATRPRVFSGSLCDWLDDEAPIEWLAALLELIRTTPNLDWLLLTKRPENWLNRVHTARDLCFFGARPIVQAWLDGNPPSNVWIGTSVENQAAADTRIPDLLQIPARVRFLSCEPLLGSIEFSNVTNRKDAIQQLGKKSLSGIHWVICGGESGPKARPMHPDWAKGLRDQCAAAGVPFLFKQWGCFRPAESSDFDPGAKGKMGWVTPDGKSYWAEHPKNGSDELMLLTSKQNAGRLLDGKEHNEFPSESMHFSP